MQFSRVLTALAAVLLFAGTARAYTPESGFWWNPAEPGYGIAIEIQDDWVFLAAYVYDSAGRATWFATGGTMTNNKRFESGPLYTPAGPGLYTAFGGTCIGCVYTPSTPLTGTSGAGPIRIDFDPIREDKATLFWGGRTIPIERHDFYLTRTVSDPKTDLLRGEWQTIIDVQTSNLSVAYPFLGDVIVFTDLATTTTPDFADGCRPDNSLVGACSTFALNNHDAAGFYSTTRQLNYMTVIESATEVLFYAVYVGTYQFDGVVKVCPRSLSNPLVQCVDSTTYPSYPVRGFRTASRAYVRGNDNAPSSVDKSLSATRLSSGTPRLGELGGGLSNAEIKSQFGIDLSDTPEEVNALFERVDARAR